MTPSSRDFYGKEVADAIQNACETLQVPQEELEIEVVETGSTGIFGLIRKKAHIKVQVKGPEAEAEESKKTLEKAKKKKEDKKPAKQKAVPEKPSKKIEDEEKPVTREETVAIEPFQEKSDNEDEEADDEQGLDVGSDEAAEAEELPEEAVELVRQELSQLLELMGYPSPVEVTAKGASVFCHVGEEYEDILTGQDGKTLDSIQYLLRKIVVRKVPNRLRLTVDVGNYREKRLAELKNKAAELAESVKNDGKTQVIPALSPSERRVVHMCLQDDKDIRSRSVGDGLFKKVLIYKPGKGNKGGGRKRNNSRGRRGTSNRKKSE